MSTPPPDWYPDPTSPARLRYWDGSRWTDHVADGHARRTARLGAAVVLLGVVAAAMWFAWLGWDHEYYRVDGIPQGPYRPWQVIGCGLAVASAAVLAQLWVRQAIAILPLAVAADVGFAIPWAVDAASTDESGLWAAGLVLLLVGSGIGLVVLLALTELVGATARRRTAVRRA